MVMLQMLVVAAFGKVPPPTTTVLPLYSREGERERESREVELHYYGTLASRVLLSQLLPC